MNDPTARVWHSTASGATYTGFSEVTVLKALQSGDLRGYQRVRRGTWRIHRDDLDAWVMGEAPAYVRAAS